MPLRLKPVSEHENQTIKFWLIQSINFQVLVTVKIGRN